MMKAEYEVTIKMKIIEAIENILDIKDIKSTPEEAIRYLCDRLVEEGFFYSYEFLETKLEVKVDE